MLAPLTSSSDRWMLPRMSTSWVALAPRARRPVSKDASTYAPNRACSRPSPAHVRTAEQSRGGNVPTGSAGGARVQVDAKRALGPPRLSWLSPVLMAPRASPATLTICDTCRASDAKSALRRRECRAATTPDSTITAAIGGPIRALSQTRMATLPTASSTARSPLSREVFPTTTSRTTPSCVDTSVSSSPVANRSKNSTLRSTQGDVHAN